MTKHLLTLGALLLVTAHPTTAQNRRAQDRNPECVAMDRFIQQLGVLNTQRAEVVQEGQRRAAECNAQPENRREACLQRLEPLRERSRSLGTQIEALQGDLRRTRALCPEADATTQASIELFNRVRTENCREGGNPQRCEDALFNLADLAYQADNNSNMARRERFERAYEAWIENDRRGKEPEPPSVNFDSSVAAHQRYLSQLPAGQRRDLVLYRLAFTFDIIGRPDRAMPLMMEIVQRFPKSRHINPTLLRVGEFHFERRAYDSAITYYNRIDLNDAQAARDGTLGLALYHRAEALYHLSRFQQSVEGFFDYVERIDRGQITRGAMRKEAILYIGSAFAEFTNPYRDAEAFFRRVGQRSYEDTLLFEMGKKLEDRDQFEQAIQTYRQFLRRFPLFPKAPLAQIGLINIFSKQKNLEEAQVERRRLIEVYGKNAPWWQRINRAAIPRRDLELVESEVKMAFLESAAIDHFAGKEVNDTVRVRSALEGYQTFVRLYEADGGWPIYRAKIYLADAYSYVGEHEKSADLYFWAALQDVSRYGAPTRGEQNLTQPADAGYNAVLELGLAANQEIERQGGNRVTAYQQPISRKYVEKTNEYITRFPNAPDAAALAYNLVVFLFGAQDFRAVIPAATRVRTQYPTFAEKQANHRMLAQAHFELKDFRTSEREYKALLAAMPQGDTARVSIQEAVASTIHQQGVAAEEAGNIEEAVRQFLRVQSEVPTASFADESAYRAGITFEKNRRHREAATQFLAFADANRNSRFAKEALQRAAFNFVDARDSAAAIRVFLGIFDRYPQDTLAFQGILQAAGLYDSSGRIEEKARTLELFFTRHRNDERTPAYLYTAGLTYERIQKFEDAIRVYNLVIANYPTHLYAPEAAFSLPIIFEKLDRDAEMAEAYVRFARDYPQDKAKVAKAYLRAAEYFLDDAKNETRALELLRTLTAFYSQGDNAVAIDASVPAQAWHIIGNILSKQAVSSTPIGGSTDLRNIARQIEARNEALKASTEAYTNSLNLKIEEWAFKSARAMAEEQYRIAETVFQIQPSEGTSLQAIQQAILFRAQIGRSIPTLMKNAANLYRSLLDLATTAGVQNRITRDAGQRLLDTYFMTGRGFESIGEEIMKEPCPSRAPEGSDEYLEQCSYHQAQKEDKHIQMQNAAVDQGYGPGVESAAQYGIVGASLNRLLDKIRTINPEHASLQVQVTARVVSPRVFVDQEGERNRARIQQIAESDDIKPADKLRALVGMQNDAVRQEEELREAIRQLRARTGG